MSLWITLSACLVAGAVWLAVAGQALHVLVLSGWGTWPRDFSAPYVAGWLAARGHAAVAYHDGDFRKIIAAFRFPTEGPWPYPPPALFLVAPFALFPPVMANILYEAAGVALLWTAAAKGVGLGWRWGLAAAFSPVAIQNIVIGQNGLFTAAALCAGLGLAFARPRLAGLILGVLVFKPQAAILVPFCLAASRRWQALGWFVFACLLLCSLSIAVFGVEPWRALFTEAPRVMADYLDYLVVNPLSRTVLVTPYETLRAAGVSKALSCAIQGVVSVTGLAVCLLAWRRARQMTGALLFATSAVSILVTPYSFSYDMAAVFAGLTLWVKEPAEQGRGILAGRVALLTLFWLWTLTLAFPVTAPLMSLGAPLLLVFGAFWAFWGVADRAGREIRADLNFF